MIGIVWAVKRERRAKKMILVSAMMNVILVAGYFSYQKYMEGEEAPSQQHELAAIGDTPPPSASFGPQPGSPAYEAEKKRKEEVRKAMEGTGSVDLAGQPLPIQNAMKANVLLAHEEGMGSGVVVQRDGDVVLILTNRHVVDHKYVEQQGRVDTPISELTAPRVTYYDKQSNDGSVIWMAPDGIDLAVVKAKAPADIQPVDWQSLPTPIVGQDVFAVGNSLGLGWSFTKGVVSGLRQIPSGTANKKLEVPHIQTDTPITFGDSGGGLYTASGQLIGINSFIVNPQLGKLGFAIRVSLLMKLKPTGLKLPDVPASKKSESSKDEANKDSKPQ